MCQGQNNDQVMLQDCRGMQCLTHDISYAGQVQVQVYYQTIPMTIHHGTSHGTLLTLPFTLYKAVSHSTFCNPLLFAGSKSNAYLSNEDASCADCGCLGCNLPQYQHPTMQGERTDSDVFQSPWPIWQQCQWQTENATYCTSKWRTMVINVHILYYIVIFLLNIATGGPGIHCIHQEKFC